jgi:hypothetical protein
MLDSNNPSHVYLITRTKKLNWVTGKDSPSDLEQFPQTIIETQNQHLYITSDDELKDGDWCYDVELKQIDKYSNTWCELAKQNARKIIATTDTLGFVDEALSKSMGGEVQRRLPSPSENFIKAYIEAHNNGNAIEDVLIEVEEIKGDLGIILSLTNEDFKLKLKDNNIIINKIKIEYTREDMIHALTYGCREGKLGRTHSDILIEYKQNHL